MLTGRVLAEPPQPLVDWLDRRSVTELTAVDDAYSGAASGDELASIATVIAGADQRISSALSSVSSDDAPGATPDLFADASYPPEVVSVIAAAVAERLVARRCFEEALLWLEAVDAEHLPSPTLAAYLRAVCLHQLVRLDEAAEHAKQVTASDTPIPRRRRAIADLILRDAAAANPDAPEHLARPMGDIGRRLSLGRSGEPEQQLQRDVLDRLDELIKQAEDQQQQQQQQASSQSAPAPSQPMEDSKPSDMKGPGQVDERRIAKGGDWGSLPPRERERVTQQIARDFPAYYRDMIEAYFRSLATGDADRAEPRDRQPPSARDERGAIP